MDKQTIIAAAQITIEDENIEYNLKAHYRLIELAANNGVQFLLFPEMSITGYVREAASRLAFTRYDARLNTLKILSSRYNMVIIAGAPVRLGAALHIGAFIIYPDQTVSLYTKQFLFDGENDFYMPNCGNNPLLSLNHEKISLAICFDMENKPHLENACESGSTIYAPGIFYTEGSMQEAHDLLSGYAKTYALSVLMSNFSGRTYHAQAGGQSAFWNSSGACLASLAKDQTGLILGIKESGCWHGKALAEKF